jgi:GT2 family glycosyltransferase
MRQVGIVIVTYNSAEEIGPCLDASMAEGAEVIVVDNASSDGTPDQVRQRGATVVVNPLNRGFAAAVNQGIRLVAAEYILLLNPDAVLKKGSLEPLRAACAASGGLPGRRSSWIFSPPPADATGPGVRGLAGESPLAWQPSKLALSLL